jgi:type II secretory ATPase GspE/PulE/Tfp pilus assembly ATPase PilB-like protein
MNRMIVLKRILGWKLNRKIDAEALAEVPVDDTIVIQFVNRIIADGIYGAASAIRFSKQSDRLDVQYCIADQWENVDSVRIEFSSSVLNRLKIMAGLDYWRQDLEQTGLIQVTMHTDMKYELTLAVTKGEHGEEHRLDIRRA